MAPPRPKPWMKRSAIIELRFHANAQARLVSENSTIVAMMHGTRPQRSAPQPNSRAPKIWPTNPIEMAEPIAAGVRCHSPTRTGMA